MHPLPWFGIRRRSGTDREFPQETPSSRSSWTWFPKPIKAAATGARQGGGSLYERAQVRKLRVVKKMDPRGRCQLLSGLGVSCV